MTTGSDPRSAPTRPTEPAQQQELVSFPPITPAEAAATSEALASPIVTFDGSPVSFEV